jgi:hypothetical protein
VERGPLSGPAGEPAMSPAGDAQHTQPPVIGRVADAMLAAYVRAIEHAAPWGRPDRG